HGHRQPPRPAGDRRADGPRDGGSPAGIVAGHRSALRGRSHDRHRGSLGRHRRSGGRTMIVRTLEEVIGTDRDVHGPGWNSRRLLLASDGMGYAGTDTIVEAGTPG